MCVCVWYWRWNPGAFYLRATPPAHFYSLFETGLTELQRASLSSWGCPQTEILQSQPPKCWDYKQVPTRPALLFFILKQGLTKLRRASLSSWGCPWTAILWSQPPKCWDYKRAPPYLANKYLLHSLKTALHLTVWLYHSFFIRSPTEEHLDCLQYLIIKMFEPQAWWYTLVTPVLGRLR